MRSTVRFQALIEDGGNVPRYNQAELRLACDVSCGSRQTHHKYKHTETPDEPEYHGLGTVKNATVEES